MAEFFLGELFQIVCVLTVGISQGRVHRNDIFYGVDRFSKSLNCERKRILSWPLQRYATVRCSFSCGIQVGVHRGNQKSQVKRMEAIRNPPMGQSITMVSVPSM